MTCSLLVAAGLFALVVFTQIHPGSSFSCYQCNSTTHAQCLENFDHEYSTLKPSKCSVGDAKYCIKVSGVWGGVVGTYRFCSSRDMGNQCQYFGFEDHDRQYRACVRTCDHDSCNSSSRRGVSAGAAALVVSTVLAAFIKTL